jgi:hypothetical protein
MMSADHEPSAGHDNGMKRESVQAMCQMFMSANTPWTNCDMTGAVTSADQERSGRMFHESQTSMNHLLT